MKKRYMVLAVVLALSILVLSGCSSFIEDAVTAMLTSSQDEEESVSESLTSESSTSEGSTTSQSESWTEGSTAIESQTAESSDSHETEDPDTTQADVETSIDSSSPAEDIEETEEGPEEEQTEETSNWSAADTVASWSGTTWRLVDYHYSNVASMSIDEIDAYMEETIVFGGTTDDTTIGIGSDLSYLATYDEQSLTDTYMVDLGSWWNSTDEVVLVAQNGVFGLGEQFFVGSGGTLWLSFDGVYFQAQQIG